jgi:hypothetical protein
VPLLSLVVAIRASSVGSRQQDRRVALPDDERALARRGLES